MGAFTPLLDVPIFLFLFVCLGACRRHTVALALLFLPFLDEHLEGHSVLSILASTACQLVSLCFDNPKVTGVTGTTLAELICVSRIDMIGRGLGSGVPNSNRVSQAVAVCLFFFLSIDLFFFKRSTEDSRETGKRLRFSNRSVFTGSGVGR
jgi:hypothetical protein